MCKKVREFLSQEGVDFVERDVDQEPVSKDELWEIMHRRDGKLRTPITLVDDDRVILGYDPDRLQEWFGSH